MKGGVNIFTRGLTFTPSIIVVGENQSGVKWAMSPLTPPTVKQMGGTQTKTATLYSDGFSFVGSQTSGYTAPCWAVE